MKLIHTNDLLNGELNEVLEVILCPENELESNQLLEINKKEFGQLLSNDKGDVEVFTLSLSKEECNNDDDIPF